MDEDNLNNFPNEKEQFLFWENEEKKLQLNKNLLKY